MSFSSDAAGSGTKQRPRLLFVVTEDWYFVSHRLQLGVAASHAGFDVVVATNLGEHEETIRKVGIRPIHFKNDRTGRNVWLEFRTFLRLLRLYRRLRPAVVHHVALKPVLYGSIAARLTGVPKVVNALGGLGWLAVDGTDGPPGGLRRLVRSGVGSVLKFGIALVQNPDDARYLLHLGVPEHNIRRIAGAGVDLQTFTATPEPEGQPMVVLPARLLWDKGVGEFVEAARLLHSRGVRATFALAGAPDLANPRSVSVQVLSEWVNEGVILHLGWVENMPEMLSRSHIVCLPSYYGEGIPKSLIESAAAGRPIVTTDMPGCREVVRNGDNGILVPPKDSAALADALQRLVEDADLRRKMGARGRARAEQEFGLEDVINKTLQLYAEPNGPGGH